MQKKKTISSLFISDIEITRKLTDFDGQLLAWQRCCLPKAEGQD